MTNDKLVSREDLPGVWKRIMLLDELGDEDMDSQVYWLQSSSLCGDIREHRRHSTLADLSSNGGAPMIDAFAGELIQTPDAFRWEPSLSFRDRAGPPDEGRLSWIGADLYEDGVHSAYRERWARIAPASEHDFALALRHAEDGRQGWLLRVGRFLFFARQLATPSGAATGRHAEFSLFELLPDGPRPVLATGGIDRAACPNVEFADAARRTVLLSYPAEGAGAARELWRVAAMEGNPQSIGGDPSEPSVARLPA